MTQAVDFAIVIPARFASLRLPGKLLLDVAGAPLLEHTWRCAMAVGAVEVVIATDDSRIKAVAEGFGAEVELTSPDHVSGTDRIAECAHNRGWAADRVIVNLQGDEPLMPSRCLQQVAQGLSSDRSADVATLCTRIRDPDEVNNPNVVKVVSARDGGAMMFSRSPLPMARNYKNALDAMAAGINWYRHLGLYAYRRKSLDWFAATGPSALEQAEGLEQLRFLEHGRRIWIDQASADIPPGVDTEAELHAVSQILSDSGTK